jgi:hypothetical protein
VLIAAIRLCAVALVATAIASGQQPQPVRSALFGRPWLHAHNAYPEKGRWADRIDRALATGATPIVIEQDVALAARGGVPASVLSHDTKLTGGEPTIEQYFFDRVRPLMERALAERRPAQWPLVVLHLDFKSNEPEHHLAVWDVLVRHRAWLTTAAWDADPKRIMPVEAGPLLVLTENGAGQEAAFSEARRPGDRLLIFGTTPAAALPRQADPMLRAQQLVETPADMLISSGATNYRRWVNFSWQAVEVGGQPRAEDWTPEDRARLTALVQRAHGLGLGIRFYTLNGHDPAAHPEWTASYNFGSASAVRQRWEAAIAAGVDLIATDQYEELGALLRSRP